MTLIEELIYYFRNKKGPSCANVDYIHGYESAMEDAAQFIEDYYKEEIEALIEKAET